MLALLSPIVVLILASFLVLSAISFHFFILQAIWIALGIGLLVGALFVDVRSIFASRWIVWGLYGLALLLMVVALFFAPVIRNTRSWLVVGPISIQPVELMKVALILVYANYFSRRHLAIAQWKNVFTSFLFFIIPAAVAIKFPDLGSALIFFGIWFGFILLLGLPWRRIAITILIFAVAGGLIWTYALKPYHRARILGFLNTNQNELGINYSVSQSKIAIGSAGLLGKGYGQGTETQLGFLSEPTEDFIFAALIEEWGILGALVVVAAFLFLIYQILRIGSLADENFEKFVCLGAAMMFGVQFLLNTGSTTGLLPVVGVTFPFLSYGGSSMIADFLVLSIVNSIRKTSRQ